MLDDEAKMTDSPRENKNIRNQKSISKIIVLQCNIFNEIDK